mgnify:CR=1 FL=1
MKAITVRIALASGIIYIVQIIGTHGFAHIHKVQIRVFAPFNEKKY